MVQIGSCRLSLSSQDPVVTLVPHDRMHLPPQFGVRFRVANHRYEPVPMTYESVHNLLNRPAGFHAARSLSSQSDSLEYPERAEEQQDRPYVTDHKLPQTKTIAAKD